MYGCDLKKLTQDRALHTPELHSSNDFYGHAFILKRYAGLPTTYSTKLAIAHGPQRPGGWWEHDLNAALPGYCVSSELARQAAKSARPDKEVFAMGPLIAYASPIWEPQQAAALKSRLGKSLLCFLSHSTHHIRVDYDLDVCLDVIAENGKEFDSVTVSIYWKDYNADLESRLSSRGFHCVTAGHMYDKFFLDRLLSYLLLSDAVLCFGYVSALIYAAYLEKLIKIVPIERRYTATPEMLATLSKSKFDLLVEKSFQEFSPLTQAQYDLLDTIGGFNEVKTPRELRNILLDMEEAYSNIDVSCLRFF